MSPAFSGAPAHQFDYVQSAEPSNPEGGESWFDTDTAETKVYDGSAGTWALMTVTDHGELASVAAGDHFSPGNVLTFNSGVLDLVFGNPLSNSNGTLGLSLTGPMTLTNGSLDVSLGNALGLSAGSIAVQEGNISHDNLSGINSADHHTRYSDSEARTAVDGANVSIAGDADTVDGKHASDLGITTAAESGTTTGNIAADTSKTISVSFTNTYAAAGGGAFAYQDGTNSNSTDVKGGFEGWQTDSNGNITGMAIRVNNADSNYERSYVANWNVFGEIA
ncbi:hypothetical protein ACFQMA_09260 [Halosimplex aquaticum]|uniref:Uncharacterized protein n=1 Tax=Halosimplex aquaticum TaxID=3026162 RepID=A0ABD5Y3V3_9EURY|nr:hypothetical protein [Halosimplex aquaticum]